MTLARALTTLAARGMALSLDQHRWYGAAALLAAFPVAWHSRPVTLTAQTLTFHVGARTERWFLREETA